MADKDLGLKLRLMNYLWSLGYIVFKNVEISSANISERKTYTDIDVLGIRFSQDLVSEYIICDCKSGQVKNAERLFWLSGVMEFFEADRGIFIRPEMLTANYLELAERLNIIPLTNNQMDELEKAFDVNKGDLFGPFLAEQDVLDNVWKEYKKHYKSEIKYLIIDYWKDLPQQQILTLISIYRRLNNEKSDNNFIHSYLYSLLSLSIMRFSRLFLMLPSSQRGDAIQKMLLGGEISFHERELILSSFYTFMTNEISARYNQKYPVSKKDFISGMTPTYTKYLIDLIIRICNNPDNSLLIPRYFNLFPYRNITINTGITIDRLQRGMSIKRPTMKPIKDFLTFLERSKLITTNLKKDYDENILEIEKQMPTTLDYYEK